MTHTNWKTFLIRVAVLCLALGVTLRVALARDGVPGGAARSYVTIAGTVSGGSVAPGSTVAMALTFRAQNTDGGMPIACTRSMPVTVDSNGSFAVSVPTDDAISACPGNLFDGRDVLVDVSVNGETVVRDQNVNPVPYAIHADLAQAAQVASSAAPDSGLDQRLTNAAATVPVGTIVAFGGATAPTGWLLCDGSPVRRDTYNALYRVLDTTYGVGDGSSTFNLPDLRGRVTVGAGSGTSLTPRTRGDRFGEERHTLTIDEMPAHNHVLNLVWPGSGGCASIGNGGPCVPSPRADSTAAGGGMPHNILPPSLVTHYIIRY